MNSFRQAFEALIIGYNVPITKIDIIINLVDPASSHTFSLKTKPCKSKYKFIYNETANSSLKQL